MKQKNRQKLKGTNVRIGDMARRIVSYLAYAIADHKQIEEDDTSDDSSLSRTLYSSGAAWYAEAKKFADSLVKTHMLPVDPDQYDLTLSKVCGIIAALSPQVTWDQNKKLAEEYLKTGKCASTRDRLSKCAAIMAATTQDEIHNSVSKKGLKTRAFYMNIRYPEVTHIVTIDRHAIAAAIQLPHNTEALDPLWQKVTDLQYAFIQQAYILATERFNADMRAHGKKELQITPQQCQAIVWVTYRSIRGLK